ncbi:MAG: DUF1570 domain-containing protein [Pirellulales bacterium]
MKHPRFILSMLLAPVLAAVTPAGAVERVILRRDGREQEITGQLLVTAQDKGMLILAPDATLWTVEPDELIEHESVEAAFQPLSAAEMAERLLAELPAGFEIHTTQRYLICHNTSRAYAQWCGALFERLYFAFSNYWRRKGFDISEPQFPLVALVFADRQSYAGYARGELGESTDAIIGYYSLRSNRMTMYDLTGIASLRRPGDRRSSAAQINAMLARPEAERTVATIIHEATHQIAFNCGLQTRYADIPLWVSEGIAVFFETPDLGSSKGWRTVGAVNRVRLAAFRNYLRRRPADSLATLIADDKRLRDARQANDAYAEAWALNYFLLRKRPQEYVAYLTVLSEKRQLVWDDPAARLAEFRRAFGQDLERLDQDFLRHMSGVR